MKQAFFLRGVFALATTASMTAASNAGPIRLDFEGLGTRAAIVDYYNGGTDSQGNSGINYGVSFGSNTLALRESDPFANFSLEPTPETVIFFLTGSAILNYAPGFEIGFSFFYSTVGFTGSVQVFDGLNATGTMLGLIDLAALGPGPDPANEFSNWAVGALSFAGTAKSINFGGTVNRVGYDNITFGSVDPRGLPEPSSLALALMTLGLGWSVRREACARSGG